MNEVFQNVIKHCIVCLIYIVASQTKLKLTRKQGNEIENYMLLKIRYATSSQFMMSFVYP